MTLYILSFTVIHRNMADIEMNSSMYCNLQMTSKTKIWNIRMKN